MSDDILDLDKERYKKLLAAFRKKYPMGEFSMPELLRRLTIVTDQLVDKKISRKRRLLLKLTRSAISKEITLRRQLLNSPAQKRWK